MLARNSQAPRSIRKHAFSLTFFASKLAPTRHGSGGLGRKLLLIFFYEQAIEVIADIERLDLG